MSNDKDKQAPALEVRKKRPLSRMQKAMCDYIALEGMAPRDAAKAAGYKGDIHQIVYRMMRNAEAVRHIASSVRSRRSLLSGPALSIIERLAVEADSEHVRLDAAKYLDSLGQAVNQAPAVGGFTVSINLGDTNSSGAMKDVTPPQAPDVAADNTIEGSARGVG